MQSPAQVFRGAVADDEAPVVDVPAILDARQPEPGALAVAEESDLGFGDGHALSNFFRLMVSPHSAVNAFKPGTPK